MQQNYGMHGMTVAWLIIFEQNKYLSILDVLHDDEQEAIKKEINKKQGNEPHKNSSKKSKTWYVRKYKYESIQVIQSLSLQPHYWKISEVQNRIKLVLKSCVHHS